MSAAVRSRYADANGIRMHYLEAGKGPALVLVHGFPQTSYEWRKVMPALAERYHVIAPDTRGFGKTDKPAGPYSRKLLAADIRGLLDALGIERAHIVGHDWGGIIAFKFICDYPRIVDRIAFIDTLLNDWPPVGAWHGLWFKVKGAAEAVFAQDSDGFIASALRGVTEHQAALTDGDIAVYQKAFRDPGAHRAAIEYYRHALPFYRVAPDRRSPHGEQYERLSLAFVTEWFNGGVANHPYRDELLSFAPQERHRTFAHPAVWMHGRWRGLEPNEKFAQQFHRAFPGIRVVPVECGHFVPEEAPEAVLRTLGELLA